MSAEPTDSPDDEQSDQVISDEIPRRSFRRSWGSFIPILGMAVCAYLLAQAKDDLSYLFAPSTPVDLGDPANGDSSGGTRGGYHLERAQPGIYARISGEVHGEGNRFQEGHSAGKIWPIEGAPVMIERRNTDPLWGLVQADGRLQSDDQLLPAFHKVIAMFLQTDQLGLPRPGQHVWLLTQGRVPRALDRTNLWLLSLMLLFLINTWLVVRPMLRR